MNRGLSEPSRLFRYAESGTLQWSVFLQCYNLSLTFAFHQTRLRSKISLFYYIIFFVIYKKCLLQPKFNKSILCHRFNFEITNIPGLALFSPNVLGLQFSLEMQFFMGTFPYRQDLGDTIIKLSLG